jgi:hypothetical protein
MFGRRPRVATGGPVFSRRKHRFALNLARRHSHFPCCELIVAIGRAPWARREEPHPKPTPDLRVDRGMECGNKPSLSAYAGDDVNEREPIVLSGGEGGIGRSRVLLAARALTGA